MEKRSLIVAIVGVVLSVGIALASVSFWLGGMQRTVDRLLDESTAGAVAAARRSIEDAADASVARLDEVLVPGSILPVYARPTNLPPGWVTCGVADGTPTLRDRFLLGTTDEEELGRLVGTSEHRHALRATTGGETSGELKSEDDGHPDYVDNIRNLEGATTGARNWYHEHELGGQTENAESLPPSVKVMFLCKVGVER